MNDQDEQNFINTNYWEWPLSLLIIAIVAFYWINQEYKPLEVVVVSHRTNINKPTLPEGCIEHMIKTNQETVTCYGLVNGYSLQFNVSRVP